jgi:diguanylate cyclase (GGDEF)-like protein
MEQATSTTTAKPIGGKERRAHVRHPVSVPVEIMIEGLGQRSAEARDFCLGGLLISFNPEQALPSDVPLEQSLCLITLKINGDDFRVRARIARAEIDSIGVAFINPDQIALQALQQHAKADAQPSSHAPDSDEADSPADKVSSGKLSQILNECNQKTRAITNILLSKYFDSVSELLLRNANQTDDLALQNTYFKTLETITNNRSLITTSFNNSINTALDNNTSLNTDSNSSASLPSLGSLELISDEEFNVWLANSKVINKVESEHPQLLGEIERRLSHIYGETVDRRNNPYGPSLFVNGFENTLQILELNNASKPVCYDAFRAELVNVTEELYQNINQILIDNNILPNLKDILAEARKLNNDKNDAQEKSEQVDEEQTAPDHTETENTIIRSNAQSNDSTAGKDVNLAKQEQGTEFTQQSVYELVGEIRNLQQQLKDAGGSGSANSGTNIEHQAQPPNPATSEQQHNLPSFSTAEVLDVINNINLPAKNINGDGGSIAAFREMLGSTLNNNQDNETGKALSIQQERIIDVTENVFTSLLNDLQVAHSIRPWLEQLAVPVMKMALLDENIFTDKNHVVRDVINKLAELEVLASAEDEEEQAAVRQAFSWVINLVNNEFDGTTKVYNRAAQQLELLINVQQQSFEKNLKQVIADAIKEEQEKSGDHAENEDDISQEDKWIRMVRRLKEDHWVLFDADCDNSKRLKVAWIAPRKGKYVFVNVMGRKDRIATDMQLAEEFKSGTAVILDGTDDPAMDRAQYGMLQKLHKQLLFQSTHDELTGLINRREFLNCIQHALEDSKLSSEKHSVCYIDIDDFKLVNNNYGFEAGDKLLKDVIELISKHLQENNVLSRIGSDQFGVLLQKTSMDEAVEFIEDIMDQLMDYRFEWEKNRVSITFSTGIAVINASTEDSTSLLQTVESSCSIAKESGGNQIQIAHSGSNRLSRRKKDMEWASKIDKALDESGLYLRCQKIIPAQQYLDPRPHYEILLGISEELGGNKSLNDFIQSAEHHNRMVAVDRWVINNAFNWLAKNEDMVSDVSLFTINLSGQSLKNEELIELIYQEVNRTSVSIENICFEVTETAGISNLSDTADFIETIKGTGCKFALDDFGTGMSSYSYLKSLPVDYLKIDGAFIKDIANNRNDYAVVKSICEIGHFMEKKVIAEYVQDEKSIAILKNIGIDFLQGYGIEKPHDLDELLR